MLACDPHLTELELQPHIPARIIFNVETAYIGLVKELASKTPTIMPILRTLTAKIPLPQHAAINGEKRFYRLTNHNRSFCYALSDVGNIFASPAVVFKGVEPLLPDFNKVVDWMLLAPFRKSSRVMADHFPLSEGKVPGALCLSEAIRECTIAAEIQSKHCRYYGELARLPVPLLVHSVSVEQNEDCLLLMRRKLAAVAFERIELSLKAGLGIYIYCYPVAPIRADAYGTGGNRNVMEYVKAYCSPEVMVSRWIQLLVRLLYLGYLPYTPRNEGFGACMDFGNAGLDGGFCDLDSIQPASSAPDDEFFFESLITSLTIMQETVAGVASAACGLAHSYLYPRINDFVLWRYVCSAFERALEIEARPGLRLDSRVRDILSPKSIVDLKRLLDRKYRPNNLLQYLNRDAGK